MEELNKIYKEFGKLMMEVSKRWKKIDKNHQMLITFQESKLCGLLSICYSYKKVPSAMLKLLKEEEFYKNLASMEE